MGGLLNGGEGKFSPATTGEIAGVVTAKDQGGQTLDTKLSLAFTFFSTRSFPSNDSNRQPPSFQGQAGSSTTALNLPGPTCKPLIRLISKILPMGVLYNSVFSFVSESQVSGRSPGGSNQRPISLVDVHSYPLKKFVFCFARFIIQPADAELEFALVIIGPLDFIYHDPLQASVEPGLSQPLVLEILRNSFGIIIKSHPVGTAKPALHETTVIIQSFFNAYEADLAPEVEL